MTPTKLYKVLTPIGWNGRREKGEVIALTEKEASAYGPAYVEEVVPEETAAEAKASLSEIPVEKLKYEQAKTLAKELGLPTDGTKADLQDRIALFRKNEAAKAAATTA